MRIASVYTAQNVVINFQVASILQRVMAYFLDLFIIFLSILIINIFIGLIIGEFTYIQYIIIAFYTPVSEILLNGQTIGKRAFKLRVMNVKGKEPVALDYLIRWAFRFIDFYLSFYTVAVILASTSTRGQRLGGLLSNTMVVSLRSEMDLNLADILRIEDRGNYEPKFQEAYRFSEDEMLTVKGLLDRRNKYRTERYEELLEEAASKCASVLQLRKVPSDHNDFLKTVLRDYIVITRS